MSSAAILSGTGPEGAPRPMTLPPNLFAAIREARMLEVATDMQNRRLWVGVPIYASLVAFLWMAGVAPWRVAVIAAMVVVNHLHQLMVLWQARACGRAIPMRSLFLGPLLAQGIQITAIALTGGLSSPLLPIMLTVLMSVAAGIGRGAKTYWVFGISAVGFVVLVLLPPSVLGPPMPRFWFSVLAGWSLLSAMTYLWVHLFKLNDAFQAAGVEISRMREDVLIAATERAHSLELVAAKVGHELKNPLASIKGLVQLVARQATDERARERLAVMGDEVARMEAIVREYLSFSRPLEELEPEPLQLHALVDEVLAVLEGRAQVAGVQLGRTGVAVRVTADRRRLREALLNLCANAVEATPQGGRVTVELSSVGGEVGIAVRDQGRGLSPEQLARVGTPFHTTREGGTGLGVALARTAIAQHGGLLRYESAPGQGTVAHVLLPSERPRPGAPVTGGPCG
jgi:signal transduction histidine kinase